MVIQSKKVWLADQFVPAAIEVNDSRITAILPYGAKDVDDDYGDKRIRPPALWTSTATRLRVRHQRRQRGRLRYCRAHRLGGRHQLPRHHHHPERGGADQRCHQRGQCHGERLRRRRDPGHPLRRPLSRHEVQGAQPDQYIVKPTIEQFEHYQKAARGHIRYVTLATEHDEDFALTRYLTAHGVVVSIGHSGATYEQAVMAYANGARSMTHVYNGMSPFNTVQTVWWRRLPHPHHVRRDHL